MVGVGLKYGGQAPAAHRSLVSDLHHSPRTSDIRLNASAGARVMPAPRRGPSFRERASGTVIYFRIPPSFDLGPTKVRDALRMTLNLGGTETVSSVLTRVPCLQWKGLTTDFCLGHQKEHWCKGKNDWIRMLIHTHTHTHTHVLVYLMKKQTSSPFSSAST